MSVSQSAGETERKSVEVDAQTIDEAIVRGLVRLGGLGRDEVKIEVLSEGKTGLLGFGAEEARVRITTLLPGESPEGPAESPADAAPEAQPEAPTPPPAPQTPAPAAESPALSEEAAPSSAPTPSPAELRASAPAEITDDVEAMAQEILSEILNKLGFSGLQMERKESLLPVAVEGEDSLVISLSGQGVDRLTARGARVLYALQFVARLMLSRRAGQWVNLLLDADGDRARRIKEIYLMAEQSAELVEREGRPVSLPPMTPYERRVVHLALREHDQIDTQSIGMGAGRKVTVRRRDQMLPDLG